jgi:lysophospholipase L1-like esterase
LLQETLARFSQEQDAVFIDAYNELAADETTLKDYVHLTVVGEQRLAELWERHLNELIAAP